MADHASVESLGRGIRDTDGAGRLAPGLARVGDHVRRGGNRVADVDHQGGFLEVHAATQGAFAPGERAALSSAPISAPSLADVDHQGAVLEVHAAPDTLPAIPAPGVRGGAAGLRLGPPLADPLKEADRRVDAAAIARLDNVAARAREAGLRSVQLLAWRDYDDPEAGGSEVHADRIASIWASVGLDVTMRTSTAAGCAPVTERRGYRVVRKSGRYAVFPRSALSGMLGRRGRPDGLVEIWNGMPFFSPLWARCPRVVFLHHVHAAMWRMVLPRRLAQLGEFVEQRVAPPLYRDTRIVTLSSSSQDEIVSMLGFDPAQLTVVPPGVERRFSPGGARSPEPLVVSVGRLVPVKRLELLIDALVQARRQVPTLRAVIVGEGYERPRLESRIAAAGATEWIELPGHLSDESLVDTYRRAWVVASTSLREGWNMTITEAGACATPAVATDIAGHRDTVADGVSGVLAEPGDAFAAALVRVLTDASLRDRLSRGALERSQVLTWEATAAGTLAALVEEAEARR